MAKTLLQITQDILSVMDGDEVNSISDTEESEQVAKAIVRTYNSFVSNQNWLHTRTGITIEGRADSNFPTHMTLKDEVKRLEFINYNTIKLGETRTNYTQMKWKEPDDFLRFSNLRNSSDTNTISITDDSGIEILILDNKAPEYYTSFNDTDLIFDSYDSEVDTTLQESKTQAVAFIIPTLALSDNAIPNLPVDAEAGFIEEATKKAQWWVRQFQDPVADEESKRQRRFMARQQCRTKGGTRYPDYGRKR